jgi:cytochrome oxidase assembly protein ShyY1
MDRGDALTRGSGLSGMVTIEGLVRTGEHTSKSIGSTTGGIPTVGAVDLDKMREATGVSVASDWVQLTGPVASGDPLPLEDPELTEGPHRGYIYQWISFTILAIVGWAVVLRREAREARDAELREQP